MAKQDDYARYTIRVPQELYSSLEAAASAANRSVNAEIVERLAYAVEHPADKFQDLVHTVHDLDKELDEAHVRIQKITKHADLLKSVTDSDFDFQRKLMYHVLNYLDDIPIELAIWAYDIISSVERTEFIANVANNSQATEAEIKQMIAERREARRKEALAAINKLMASDE